MQRRTVLGSATAALAFGAVAKAAGYPERPITLICPWGAGGGTDATARIVASVLERDLGVPVNVVNRTGGSGVVGHSAIATAAPDGYTLGIITVEIGMMHWQGLTELSYKNYTPLALMNEDPAGIQVRSDSSYDSAKGLLEAVRGAAKSELKASGTGQGGIWHLALAGMLQAGGMPPDPGAAAVAPVPKKRSPRRKAEPPAGESAAATPKAESGTGKGRAAGKRPARPAVSRPRQGQARKKAPSTRAKRGPAKK